MSFSVLFLFNNSHFLLHFRQFVFELFISMTSHHFHAVLQLLGVVDTLLGPHLPVEVRYLILKPVNLAA